MRIGDEKVALREEKRVLPVDVDVGVERQMAGVSGDFGDRKEWIPDRGVS